MKSWAQFFEMGGYAFYVWGSYLATLILMGGEVLMLLRRGKRRLQQVRDVPGRQGKN